VPLHPLTNPHPNSHRNLEVPDSAKGGSPMDTATITPLSLLSAASIIFLPKRLSWLN
jgi:hypothetical protein